MADPATITLITRAAIAAATDKRTWKIIGVIIAALLTPVILSIVVILSLLSATAEHNNEAIDLAFHGGAISSQVPAEYANRIQQMRDSFSELDIAIEEVNAGLESGTLDDIRVKAVFYSLFFGAAPPSMDSDAYRSFVDCFVKYETRSDSTVAIPLISLAEIYTNLEHTLGRKISREDQINASEIYYRILYGGDIRTEGDDFGTWPNWQPQLTAEQLQDLYHNLPEGEVGADIVRTALTRLGDPYSQAKRGQNNYTDCSYLTLWCYAQFDISIPGTAATQGKFCVENGLTIAKEDLVPGDLIFWSYKYNGQFMNITHVGIYAGEGKVIDASSSRGQVVYRNLFDDDKQVLYGRPHILYGK